ncbi:MAG: aminoglycoside phosphotransferase family protein, partial [Planctomycetota bacterium]
PWLSERYGRVVERLLSLPLTVFHGEFYASNVLVRERHDTVRICPVDWEMAAVGPGLMDVAALTAGAWSDAERTSLAMAYHAALPPDGSRPSQEALLTALDWCRLHLAVRWLGWSPGWSPPPEHAQDWLGEALRLAEKLDL